VTIRWPSGNITGFTLYEYEISAKWLEPIKEIAPQVKREAVLWDARISSEILLHRSFVEHVTWRSSGRSLSRSQSHGRRSLETTLSAPQWDSSGRPV
jgi:hypothetical protein